MKSIARCLSVFDKIFAIVVWSSLKLFSNLKLLLNRLRNNFCFWNFSFLLFVFKLQIADWSLSDSEQQFSIFDVLFSIFNFRLLNDCWYCSLRTSLTIRIFQNQIDVHFLSRYEFWTSSSVISAKNFLQRHVPAWLSIRKY